MKQSLILQKFHFLTLTILLSHNSSILSRQVMQDFLVDQDCIQEEMPIIDTEVIAKTMITLFQSYMPDEIIEKYESSTRKLFNPNEALNGLKSVVSGGILRSQPMLRLSGPSGSANFAGFYSPFIPSFKKHGVFWRSRIKVEGPEFDECNLAAEFVLVQFLKNIFGDQSCNILQALNMPMISSVLNNLNNKTWIRHHQMIARETPQEGSRDSIEDTPYSRLNKIEKERINNCRIIEQLKDKQRKKLIAYNMDANVNNNFPGETKEFSQATVEMTKARLLYFVTTNCPQNQKQSDPFCAIVQKFIEQLTELLKNKQVPVQNLVLPMLDEFEKQLDNIKEEIKDIAVEIKTSPAEDTKEQNMINALRDFNMRVERGEYTKEELERIFKDHFKKYQEWVNKK